MTSQASTQIASWIANFESKMAQRGWIKCPTCSEEWTKLRPCSFFDGEKVRETYVCLNCAETVANAERVLAGEHRSNLPGVTLDVKWRGPRYRTIKIGGRRESNFEPENAYAVISGGGRLFTILCEGTGRPLKIIVKDGKEPMFADNIYAAWYQIHRRLMNPLEEEPGEARVEKIESMIRGKKATPPKSELF